MLHLLPRNACLLAIFAMALPEARADSRNFSMPAYQTNPGSILEVPLTLDNAAGLAAIQVQINFDPAVLDLLSVESGPLGDHFELSQGEGEGLVQLTYFRVEALAGGTGQLAVLRFRANPGAETDLQSELALADVILSDETGVIDLNQKDTLGTHPGQVTVTVQPDIDNAGSGLPDWWEELHGLDLFTPNAGLDPEHDGMPNLLEYAFGGNPLVADAQERGVRAGRVEADGATFLSLSFYRRLGDTGLLYRVQESTDLGIWETLSPPLQIIGTPQDMGDGTEHVTVRGTIPVTGPNAQPKGFLRVDVEKP